MHEPGHLQLVLSEDCGQVGVEPPDDLAVALGVNGDGPTSFFEPVWAQQSMSDIVGHEGSDLRTFHQPFCRLFRWLRSPEDVVVAVDCAVKVEMCLV